MARTFGFLHLDLAPELARSVCPPLCVCKRICMDGVLFLLSAALAAMYVPWVLLNTVSTGAQMQWVVRLALQASHDYE